jgi:hypothetical protein
MTHPETRDGSCSRGVDLLLSALASRLRRAKVQDGRDFRVSRYRPGSSPALRGTIPSRGRQMPVLPSFAKTIDYCPLPHYTNT